MQATEFGFVTLVGYISKSYPTDHGNCFSVIVEKPKPGEKDWEAYDRISRRVVNMHYENFRELLRTGVLLWPVEVAAVGDKHCAVIDERVPDEWKLVSLCGSCAPNYLLCEVVPPYMRQTQGGNS